MEKFGCVPTCGGQAGASPSVLDGVCGASTAKGESGFRFREEDKVFARAWSSA
jgi:hypothetical protein